MTDVHVHNWVSVTGECGQYVCSCAATGYRNFNGDIRAHRTHRVRSSRFGRIPPKPVGR